MWRDKIVLMTIPLLWSACQSSPSTSDIKSADISETSTVASRPNKVTDKNQKTNSTPEAQTTQNTTFTQEVLQWRQSLFQINTPFLQEQVYPYQAPSQENIAQNIYDSGFETLNKNISLIGAKQDTQVAHSGKHAICLAETNDTLVLKNIPVEEGAWYVITGYMYTDMLPMDIIRYYIEYRDQSGGIDIPNYPMVAISKVDSWEHFALPVYIKKDFNVKTIQVVFRHVGYPKQTVVAQSGKVWLDDISLHKVSGSGYLYGFVKPGRKYGFDGQLVKVDALGNFSLKSAYGYSPFLPIIIYPGGNIQQWDKYQKKGFNTIICNSLAEAKKAVDLGMYWIWSLYDYGIYDGDRNGYQRFEQEYQLMREKMPELMNKLLYFYWDNERYKLFDSVKYFSDTIKRIDVDAQGNRLRPFVMQLDFATANPHYHNESFDLVDLQALYANPMVFEDNDPRNYQGVEFKGYYDGEFANFAIFENLPGVTIPKSVFVVNSPFGDKHLANTIFAAFARGGKAFAYWKDGGSQPAIETKSWWNDFNQTVWQMHQVLPLLRQPHWTRWDLNISLSDDEDGLVVGKRDLGQKQCIIYASRSNKAEKVYFAMEGVQDGRRVFDYFSGRVRAKWQQGVFSLKLKPRDYGVCCW